MNTDISKAVEIVKSGGIVIFPTDTAFGIGCRVDDKKAVERLFALRKRPIEKATPVLVSSAQMAQEYLLEIPEEVDQKLIKPYWPGALTIILSCQKEKIPSMVRGGGETLGVRMPDHHTTLELIMRLGVPILGPSANFAGEETPFRFEDLNPELVALGDYIVPGVCKQKQASTVIDCTVSPWKILRQGAVYLNFLNFRNFRDGPRKA